MAMTEQQSDWHHFRPVLHLRHFAGVDKRVWVYDRGGRFPPRQDVPRNVGAEYFLYSPGHASNQATSDEFERWLATNIDGPASAPLARVARGDLALSPADRVALGMFIATQDMRTPLLRDLLVPAHQSALESEWPEIARSSLKAWLCSVAALVSWHGGREFARLRYSFWYAWHPEGSRAAVPPRVRLPAVSGCARPALGP